MADAANFDDIYMSIVVPVFNEEDSIPLLHKELLRASSDLPRSEIIYVDDGSSDSSATVIKGLLREGASIRLIRLGRNLGQSAAFAAGFHAARGRVIATLDADLQNDPADIPRLLSRLEDGVDIVSGWRKDRQDARIRRNLLSRVANRLISKATGVKLHDFGCSLKVYRADALREIMLIGEMHRFIPALAAYQGASVVEVPVNHRSRQYGNSKYGTGRVIRVLLDALLLVFMRRYLARPIHFFGTIGLTFVFLSNAFLGASLVLKYLYDVSMISTPLPTLSGLLFLIGILAVLLGLSTEITVRTFFRTDSNLTKYFEED